MPDLTSTFPGSIVVAGANGGLGREVVDYLLNVGHRNIVCVVRDDDRTISEILERNGLDPRKHIFRADLCSEEAVSQLGNGLKDNFGRVWGIVNLVGVSGNGASWKLQLADFKAVVEGNLIPAFLLAREFSPGMRSEGGGRIINVASVVAHVGAFGASHYAAGKAALIGFSKTIALELVSKSVTVNTISLGYFDHGMIKTVPEPMLSEIIERVPMKRLGRAHELSATIHFLLSEGSSYITGQDLHVNGGQYA